jgi:hypothetical protein
VKRWLAITAGLLMTFAAAADDGVRFGNQLILYGDSESKVLSAAGEPVRRVPVQNKFGAVVGERLDYEVGNKTVQITIKNGQVAGVNEILP